MSDDEEDIWLPPSDVLIVLAGHPYFKFAEPAVWQQPWDKRWVVKWRDFHTMKQDVVFDTKEEAEAFAATICKPPMTVYDDTGELGHYDQIWRELDAKSNSKNK